MEGKVTEVYGLTLDEIAQELAMRGVIRKKKPNDGFMGLFMYIIAFGCAALAVTRGVYLPIANYIGVTTALSFLLIYDKYLESLPGMNVNYCPWTMASIAFAAVVFVDLVFSTHGFVGADNFEIIAGICLFLIPMGLCIYRLPPLPPFNEDGCV